MDTYFSCLIDGFLILLITCIIILGKITIRRVIEEEGWKPVIIVSALALLIFGIIPGLVYLITSYFHIAL